MDGVNVNKWDNEKILKEIKKLKILKYGYNKKHNRSLVQAAIYHFGSWKNALEISGFNYDNICDKNRQRQNNIKWSKEKILKDIALLDDKRYTYVCSNNSSLAAIALYHFGSWEKAITLAGFDYSKIKKQPYSKDKIIEEILKLDKYNNNYNKKYNKTL